MFKITRREFASIPVAGAATPAEPWNLLLITCDQWRADCLGAYGNRVIRTPRLDQLAREGVLFESHYVQCPQCVPSRAAIHTGRYPHVNRTPSNLYRLPDSEQTLAMILNQQGYLTAAVGEMPFAPTQFRGGFQQIYASDGDYREFLRRNRWQAKATEHRERLKTGFQAHPAPWPELYDETVFYAEQAIAFLRANAGRPFFLHVNFRRPHHPFDPPAPFDRLYLGSSFPPSPRREGEMLRKPPGQTKALENTAGFDLRRMTAEDLERIKAFYYGMISLNDKYIGRLLDALDELGLASRTIVVVTSDHGEMLGDHGLLFKGGYFYEGVVRVPLIIRAPGKLASGQRISRLTEAVDLLPTLLRLLDLRPPGRVQGRDLFQGQPRSAVFSEFPNIKMVRTKDWKLVHYLRAPYGELYDLRNDPNELDNLYADAGYVKTRDEMRSLLADWLIESEDPALPPIKA